MFFLENKIFNDELQFAQNFNSGLTSVWCQAVKTGFAMYHSLTLDDFFKSYNKGKSVRSQLLTFAIEKSLHDFAFKSDAVYTVNVGALNNYGYNGLHLITERFWLTVAKTQRASLLPKPARYKKELARLNENLHLQMKLDCINGDIVLDDYKYAMLTYGHNDFSLSHLNIVVPCPRYEDGIISGFSMDILKADNLVVMPSDVSEEQIASLKKEFVSMKENA